MIIYILINNNLNGFFTNFMITTINYVQTCNQFNIYSYKHVFLKIELQSISFHFSYNIVDILYIKQLKKCKSVLIDKVLF